MHHIMKDGKIIRYIDMSDSNLLNTIALCQRRATDGITIREGSSGFCPDDFCYDEYMLYGTDALKKMNYNAYVEEANRRGLNLRRGL